MEKNSGNFSIEDIKKLASTPAGQQLLAMLQNADPAALQDALRQAKSGNIQQAQQTLAPLMASEELRKLLQQLGG